MTLVCKARESLFELRSEQEETSHGGITFQAHSTSSAKALRNELGAFQGRKRRPERLDCAVPEAQWCEVRSEYQQ